MCIEILGRLDEAEAILNQCLQRAEMIYGPEHAFTLTTVTGLGAIYHDRNQFNAAECTFIRALQGLEKYVGPMMQRLSTQLRG